MRGLQRAPWAFSITLLVASLAPVAGAAFPEDITQLAFASVAHLTQQALPDSSQQVVLVGEGLHHVERNGKQGDCEGTKFVLEASHKVLRFEPTITLSFGGGTHSNPSFALPCGQGHTHQPTQGEVTGSFEGAWSATKVLDPYWFTFAVSAPQPDGMRTIAYEYHAFDGSANDSFVGAGAELR